MYTPIFLKINFLESPIVYSNPYNKNEDTLKILIMFLVSTKLLLTSVNTFGLPIFELTISIGIILTILSIYLVEKLFNNHKIYTIFGGLLIIFFDLFIIYLEYTHFVGLGWNTRDAQAVAFPSYIIIFYLIILFLALLESSYGYLLRNKKKHQKLTL